MKKMERLTSQEEKAMRRLWAIGDGTIKDILSGYAYPQPPYTTLASIVKNLEQKGYVKARKVGNTYLYRPLVEEKNYKCHSLARIVNDYFGNSYKELVSFFVKENNISTEELKEMLALIEQDNSANIHKSSKEPEA